MPDDPLDHAHTLGAARLAIGVRMAAAGAEPSTPASRDGHGLEPGAVVYDPKTGQHGVVRHARIVSVIAAPDRS